MNIKDDQFIITNNGERFVLAMHSAVHPGAYIALCEFAENVEYVVIDAMRFTLNEHFLNTATDEILRAKHAEEWAPYDENWQEFKKVATEIKDKIEGVPKAEGGQYL